MTGSSTTRRAFLKASALSSLALGSAAAEASVLQAAMPGQEAGEAAEQRGKRPNIVLLCADQLRPDFIGAYGENSMTRTPNIDGMVKRGTAFTNAVTNQPLCSPSRACMITGRYATETGEWKLSMGMDTSLPTLASVLHSNGYTTHFLGKWHLAKVDHKTQAGYGYVPPDKRHGFVESWEGANEYEHTTHPYFGTIWDTTGKEINYKDEYRIDFITGRAVDFLKQPHEKPFLLYVSQLEPHQQNDLHKVVAPKGYADRYINPFVPADLRNIPGDWQEQLPDYYGCAQKIDEFVGVILSTLKEQNLLDNTIVAFISDHGCHFKTRNAEYKRSAHDSSIRIPFVFQGPGFHFSAKRDEIVSMIDLTPTLLSAAGVPVPESMKGRNLLPLITSMDARDGWDNVAYVQISGSMIGRALRTREWCYCVVDRSKNGNQAPASTQYEEYQMYNLCDDPTQQVNLAGRREFVKDAAKLRSLMKQRMREAGEEEAEIVPAKLYP